MSNDYKGILDMHYTGTRIECIAAMYSGYTVAELEEIIKQHTATRTPCHYCNMTGKKSYTAKTGGTHTIKCPDCHGDGFLDRGDDTLTDTYPNQTTLLMEHLDRGINDGK